MTDSESQQKPVELGCSCGCKSVLEWCAEHFAHVEFRPNSGPDHFVRVRIDGTPFFYGATLQDAIGKLQKFQKNSQEGKLTYV